LTNLRTWADLAEGVPDAALRPTRFAGTSADMEKQTLIASQFGGRITKVLI
jgi:hypothetical protein